METEVLPEVHTWLRIADPAWVDPLDPAFACVQGGRWNPPDSFPALYLNEDLVTARLNVRLFIAGWPYEPEDLRLDTGPCLVAARLPRAQRVADAHTPAGALHYSACLQARHFAAQIMSHEGQHCRLVGPVVVHGAVLTVREDCRVSHFSGQHGVRVHLTARVRVQAGGHQFTGQSHTVITTPLGNITEHQKITGVWVAPCRAP
jgi:RES domain-containing protein